MADLSAKPRAGHCRHGFVRCPDHWLQNTLRLRDFAGKHVGPNLTEASSGTWVPVVFHSQCSTARGTKAVFFDTMAKNSIGLSPRFSPACLRVGTQSTAPGV